jgi:hypothetical protein
LAAARSVPAPGTVAPSAASRRTDLATLLEQAFRTAAQRSLIFVLSDFLDGARSSEAHVPGSEAWRTERDASSEGPAAEGSQWERALAPLTRRHEVVGVWIRDPREVELPDVGVVTFEDAETGEQLVVDTSQPSLRAAYAALGSARAARLEQIFGRHGATLWTLSTAEPFVPALVRFLDHRRRTLLGAQRLLGRPG